MGRPPDTGACEKNTPPEKKTLWNIGSQSTKSGAGEQFWALDRMAKAWVKGNVVYRHRYMLFLLRPTLPQPGAWAACIV